VDHDDFVTAKSRLTGRGYEQELQGDETFFAATPREVVLRILCVLCHVFGLVAAVADAAQAFLQAPLTEATPLYIYPPPEAEEPEGIVWLLKKTLPGLKGGPRGWGDFVDDILNKEYDMVSSVVEPCMYRRGAEKFWALRHMDDFFFVAGFVELRNTLDDMKDRILLRGITYLDKAGDCAQFLGRTITRIGEGFTIKVVDRLASLIVADAGLLMNPEKPPGVPGVKERTHDETPSTREEHKYYRSQTGRLIFQAQYRPDEQFATGQLSRHVQAPTKSDEAALKRVIRYLSRTADYTLYLCPKGPLALWGHGDADWAGQPDRKSVSGGTLFLAAALIMSYSKTQAVYALSSCESELYGIGSLASELLWVFSLLHEQTQLTIPPTLFTDSSSALTLVGRRGTGRLRHIEVKFLAIQEWISKGRLVVKKILSAENSSDILTKYVDRKTLEKHLMTLGVRRP